MKRTTPSLSFGFQRLKSNNTLLLAFFILLGASFTQNNSTTKATNVIFYSKENQQIRFSSDSTYVIVIKNNKSCRNCFNVILNYMQAIKNKTEIHLIAITHSDSTSLARKRNIYESEIMFPNLNQYGVSYSSHWNESSPTPELLLIKNNEITELKYYEIFEDGFENISSKVQDKVKKIINSE